MELQYHSCGCPIRVWDVCRRTGEPMMFDGRSSWTERTIRTCPRCGERLSRTVLLARPPAPPTGTLAAYALVWPYLRLRLEGLIAQRAARDHTFCADQAQADILALERALDRVTDLAARLEAPIQPASVDTVSVGSGVGSAEA